MQPEWIKSSAGVSLDSVTCNLLTHSSDGLWYVFDGNNELLSIPDDQVLQVRTFGKLPRPSTEQQRNIEEVTQPEAKKAK